MVGDIMGPKFFQTVMGRGFFENQLPELIQQLKCIALELRRYNDRQEQQDWDKRHARRRKAPGAH